VTIAEPDDQYTLREQIIFRRLDILLERRVLVSPRNVRRLRKHKSVVTPHGTTFSGAESHESVMRLAADARYSQDGGASSCALTLENYARGFLPVGCGKVGAPSWSAGSCGLTVEIVLCNALKDSPRSVESADPKSILATQFPRNGQKLFHRREGEWADHQ
jgi:hypothetical protein